jgi:hypothetical protein
MPNPEKVRPAKKLHENQHLGVVARLPIASRRGLTRPL